MRSGLKAHTTLTVKTREGTGVRSLGWIMDRTEGRWPSRDPTKNSLKAKKRVLLQPPPEAVWDHSFNPALQTGLDRPGFWVRP